MKNIKLRVSYDGTNYYGWQKQKQFISIQEVLEGACEDFFGQAVTIRGASRTDARVHALGQCASLLVDTVIPAKRIPLALNRILPEDIIVTCAKEVPLDFHPQYFAKRKTYSYAVLNAEFPIPQLRNYSYFVYTPLDVEAMDKAAQDFVGSHDFLGFCSSSNTKKITRRKIDYVKVIKKDELIIFEVCGEGFLYNMVRIMVGTLIDIGSGELRPEAIKEILLSKDRKQAGITVPASGLTLCHIEY